MNTKIYKNYEELSKGTANFIINYVKKKPESLLCFAGGDTPLMTYRYLGDYSIQNREIFNKCKFISLDEWVGLDGNDQGSCRYTLQQNLFSPLKIKDENIHFFNAKGNLKKECHDMNKYIEENGPIDIALLGVGVNGHIGFNEPGISFEKYSHVVELDQTTKQVGKKYFKEDINLEMGITLGIKHIKEADSVILLVNGEKKADIVKKVFEVEVNNQVPATIAKEHNNSYLFLDEKAAFKINK